MTSTAAQPPPPDAPTRDDAIVRVVDLSAGYAKRPVIEGATAEFRCGELVGIVGPNGCGKSTLLKSISGNLTPMAGQVLIDNQPLAEMPRRHRARLLAMLPQHPDGPPGMTVRDLVHCGRAPHSRWFEPFDTTDRTAIEHAIRSCELGELADRPLAEISGGERQRAWIAMTLAQQTRVLLLDEPTSALDIGHQLDVMHLLQYLARERDMAVTVVMHDINLAIRFCDRVLVMQRGRLVGSCLNDGAPDWSLLERVFGVAIDTDGPTKNNHHLAFTRPSKEQPCGSP